GGGGAEGKRGVGGLGGDAAEGVVADRGGYKIVVPGDPAASRLVARISSNDKATRMPPAQAGAALTGAQIETIRRWIAEGARWQQHWAFIPPQRPAVPGVRNEAAVRNPIDRFVLARLEREGLKPSPEADRATLLRRLAFDLT